MKKQLRKWLLRFLATGFFIIVLLSVIVLKPALTYGAKTNYHQYTIYHNRALNDSLKSFLNNVQIALKKSEYNDNALKLDICLNDGSKYPALIEKIRGQAFGWGFYNKVVLSGKADYENNRVELNGYSWNMKQLIVHEAIHCLQFDKLGLFGSNPFAGIPEWKWEGYAEYISRNDIGQSRLADNISRLMQADKSDKDSWAIYFEDGTIAPRRYYGYWLLMQYCMDIKKMSYAQVLSATIGDSEMTKEMMHWYQNNKSGL